MKILNGDIVFEQLENLCVSLDDELTLGQHCVEAAKNGNIDPLVSLLIAQYRLLNLCELAGYNPEGRKLTGLPKLEDKNMKNSEAWPQGLLVVIGSEWRNKINPGMTGVLWSADIRENSVSLKIGDETFWTSNGQCLIDEWTVLVQDSMSERVVHPEDHEKVKGAIDIVYLMDDVIKAARHIQRHYDIGSDGMVVGRSDVYKLWSALRNLDTANSPE